MSTKQSYGFLALFMRQSLIQRWSLMRTRNSENVLEHSAMVAMLSLIAGTIAVQNGKDVDLTKIMSHSLLHDISEVITGDIVTPIKHSNETILGEIRKIESLAEKKLLATLPDSLQDSFAQYFEPQGYEQVLVKACDVYAAYIKCKSECLAGNAIEFEDAFAAITQQFESQTKLCPEILVIHNMFTDAFSLSVDKLIGPEKKLH